MDIDQLIGSKETTVIYDGDCPFCKTYVKFMRFRETVGSVNLLDARSQPELVKAFKSKGYDINNGMVFIMNQKVHYGDDAVFAMSLLSTSVGVFNRLNSFIFSKPILAKTIYPVLVVGRKIVLKLLRKTTL
ncbi:MAG: DCC1-like thiol-disulfide oxidoreductase family protein [Oleispira sp.]